MKRRKTAVLLREKLFRGFIPLMIIMIVLLSVLFSYLFLSQITSNTLGLRQENNRQILRSIDEYLDSLTTLVTYPYLDRELMTILQKDYAGENTALEKAQDGAKVRDKLAMHVYHTRQDINSAILIMLRSGVIYSAARGTFRASSDYQDSDWYRSLIDAEGEIVYLGLYYNILTPYIETNFGIGRSIRDPRTGETLGVMILNTMPEKLTNLWKDERISGTMIFTLDAQNRVFHDNDLSLNEDEIQKRSEDFLSSTRRNGSLLNLDGKVYWGLATTGGNYNWSVISMTNLDSMIRSSLLFFLIMLIMLPLVWTLLKRSSQKLAARILKPLDQLRENMDEAALGNLSVRAMEGEDEIGILGKRFNHMSDRLATLIDRIHTEENERRNSELLALQSQINPHFLYNTLSSIRVMAQMQGAKRVAAILEELIQFLRACTKSTEETIPVRQELDMCRHYLDIMNFRYMGNINYRISADESIMNAYMPRFTLQPFLENAITHGIDLSGDGHILLKGKRDGNDLVFLIADNGRGMTEEQCDALLKQKSDAGRTLNVGVDNVYKRIQLKYGEPYGISIRSRPGSYTVINIRIPWEVKEITEK